MAIPEANEVIQHLRKVALLRDGAGVTDGQLLEDFISRRDEAALATLVRRHGPMVWGVCRRVLRDYHDAEDAFQATFLVLVRRAASIASKELLANWLYGVAHRTALKARAMATRRKERERQVKEMPEPTAPPQEIWQDLQPLLDQELGCLPNKYRVVLVLCDLTGKTRREAARQLGVPEGTVAGRLARARDMLAKRLVRRGLVLSGGALAVVLAQNAASAGVPAALLSNTIQVTTLLAAGQVALAGVVSAKVTALTNGVLNALALTRLKLASTVLVLVTVIGGGTALVTYRPVAAESSQARQDDAPRVTARESANIPDPSEVDRKRLQGVWVAVSQEINGESRTHPNRDEIRFNFDGDRVTYLIGKQKLEGAYHLDATRSPRAMDVVSDRTLDMLLIYEVAERA